MRFTTAILSLAATAGLATASMVSAVANVPDCAVHCMNKGAIAKGCTLNNFQCMCEGGNLPDIVKAATSDCNACGLLDSTKSGAAVAEICATFAAKPTEGDVVTAAAQLQGRLNSTSPGGSAGSHSSPQTILQGVLGLAAVGLTAMML